jgi:hypothetical protein
MYVQIAAENTKKWITDMSYICVRDNELHIYIHIVKHIEKERERERERDGEKPLNSEDKF